MTMKCAGLEVNGGGPPSDAGEAGRDEGSSTSAVSEVNSNVTKSRGVVGPGNWADRWYTGSKDGGISIRLETKRTSQGNGMSNCCSKHTVTTGLF